MKNKIYEFLRISIPSNRPCYTFIRVLADLVQPSAVIYKAAIPRTLRIRLVKINKQLQNHNYKTVNNCSINGTLHQTIEKEFFINDCPLNKKIQTKESLQKNWRENFQILNC